jgi:hypothetical protein
LTAELDIYRAAKILVKEYGAEQAPLMAAKRAFPMPPSTALPGRRRVRMGEAGRQLSREVALVGESDVGGGFRWRPVRNSARPRSTRT